MNRRNPILTAALCVSLVAHGMALSGLAWWYIAHTPSPKTDPINRYQVMVDQMAREQPKPAATVPPPPPPPPPPPKLNSLLPPPPKAERLEKPKAHKDDSGEANSSGTANRSTAGVQPMEANSGYEQADLMKDAKEFIDSAFAPASDGQAQGNNALPQKSPKAGSFVPDLVAQANAQNALEKAAPPPPTKGPGPLPKLTDPAPTQTTSGTNAPVANVPVAQSPTPKPVQKKIQGHRATLSDTESIAFAKQNSAVFHAGHLEGRKGLKVKTTTPRFGDASYQDMEALGGIRTVIQAKVDADGNVVDVQVYESSGSANIDQDCKLAVWNWILEPEKDKEGHPTDLNWMIAFE